MKCPYCNNDNTKVIDSRQSEDNQCIRRRRKCEQCGKRFTTYEKIETLPIMVIKKDNSREPFNREKLFNGILKSCHKRPISREKIEDIVDEIENIVSNSLDKEIASKKIGELIMDKMIAIDEVAYLRFASVYKEFKDINTFLNEIEKLIKANQKNN